MPEANEYMFMLAVLTSNATVVNHFIRGAPGTLHAALPVAMHCLKLAQLI